MARAASLQTDPFHWNALIAFGFFVLSLIRLAIPSTPLFDEVHYLPAARILADFAHPTNVEHPLLGKQFIALGMAMFGDNSFGWRVFPLLAGTVTLFALQRALWFASFDRYASIAGGLLLATGFPLFIQSRIAMLDIFMLLFVALALWMCAAALREPHKARRLLAIAGVSLGLAMGSKWNAIPIAMVPGLAFLVIRLEACGRRFLLDRDCRPIPGMSLLEAGLWLGLFPLLAYALTFWPALFYEQGAITPLGIFAYHEQMLHLQTQVLEPHPYQSNWPQWVMNSRAIWYLYEVVDGAQRGMLLVGNPVSFLLGLPAMAWCAWQGIFRKRWDCLGLFVLYAASLGLWLFASKSVQFFYHYFLPSCFLLGALGLALAEMRKKGDRWLPMAALALSVAMFAWFYPVLSAAELSDAQDFLKYAWITGWR